MRELVFAGFGGQGILTAGLIVSHIALHKGYNATWMPAYGAAMRGGTANCTVKYGGGFIYNPGQQKPDLVLAMNTPSFEKFVSIVKPGGIMLVNSDMMTVDLHVRNDIRIIGVPCLQIANKLRNLQGANIVMVGSIVKLLSDFTKEEAIEGMNDMFRKKGKEEYEAKNVVAFETGYDAV